MLGSMLLPRSRTRPFPTQSRMQASGMYLRSHTPRTEESAPSSSRRAQWTDVNTAQRRRGTCMTPSPRRVESRVSV